MQSSRACVCSGLREVARFRGWHFSTCIIWLALALAIGSLASGCAAKLAPDYEKAIVDGLSKANEDTMTLFASVSAGGSKATYVKRQASYDGAIGKFEAVRVQVATRPAPQISPLVTRIVSVGESGTGNQKQLEIPAAPTTEIVAKIVRDLTVMRDTDKGFGLDPRIVVGFKREYETSIEQALTYEKQLQR